MDKTYFVNMRNKLTEKQKELLARAPKKEFRLKDIGGSFYSGTLTALVNKGFVEQFVCRDPNKFGSVYKLVKGKR